MVSPFFALAAHCFVLLPRPCRSARWKLSFRSVPIAGVGPPGETTGCCTATMVKGIPRRNLARALNLGAGVPRVGRFAGMPVVVGRNATRWFPIAHEHCLHHFQGFRLFRLGNQLEVLASIKPTYPDQQPRADVIPQHGQHGEDHRQPSPVKGLGRRRTGPSGSDSQARGDRHPQSLRASAAPGQENRWGWPGRWGGLGKYVGLASRNGCEAMGLRLPKQPLAW